ncbi:SusD/RagB family nutrient-binding outer membrane lipoprotein [Sinomicrobium sp. M5D2P17]
MKSIYKTLFIILFSSLSLGSCTGIDDLQDDPNRALEVPPELLLTQLETRAFNTISLSAALATRQMVYTDGVNSDQYYNWQRSGFDAYDDLKQVQQMILEAERTEIPVYKSLARFFNAYFITGLTRTFGDVPYTEAILATEGNFTPVYDKQKDIYLSVLNELKTASEELAENGENIRGDVIYNGDPLLWRKLINSYYLRVLLSLSGKTGDADLNIVQRFREVVDNPTAYPVLASPEEDGILPFLNIEGNRYPLFQNNGLQTAYYMEKTFVDKLKTFEDPRLFYFAQRTPQAVKQELDTTDFEAYNGLNGSAPLDENVDMAGNGEASMINERYYKKATTEPSFLISYAELQFILAEAAHRGWIDQDTETFYKNGIKASMTFYNIPKENIDTYLQNPSVQLGDHAIESILTQKHIAMFMNTGWQMFFEQRRTGYPEFDVSGGGVLNNGRIPKRWMYPAKELTQNQANVDVAIKRQFPEGDDINAEMWLLKEE